MFKLNNLKAPLGSNSSPKRKGRGIGSGNGKTAGRGHKGQKARSGAPIHPVFEGGQMHLSRKSPKIGFRSHLKKLDFRISINDLGKPEWVGKDLKIQDLLSKTYQGMTRFTVTLVGSELTIKNLPRSIEVHRASPMALNRLRDKGVDVKVISKKRSFDGTLKNNSRE